jgi:surface protein
MFHFTGSFNQDLGDWDVSKVTDMTYMFFLSGFNRDIGSWDVSKVTNMNGLFRGARSFNQDISDWDVSSVTNFSVMFSGASAFNQDIGGWNMSTVQGGDPNNSIEEGLEGMLDNCGMSIDSYDATLNGWAAQSASLTADLELGAEGLNYSCTGKEGRDVLINSLNWTITGDELDGACNPFITTWQTTAEDPEVIIYTNPGYDYNYTIDWGDGTVEENVTADISHTYSDHGMPHTVSISGEFPHFLASSVDRTVPTDPLLFATDENAEQLRSVEAWGEIQWSDFSYAFALTEEFAINATDLPDLSQVSSMKAAFLSSDSFNSDISAWEVGNVTDMHGMFFGAAAFNQPLDSWNVSNVTDMRLMFSGATVFNQDIGGWEVGNVLDMNFMFSNTGSFSQNIGNWNVGNVMNMSGMFLISSGFNGDISAWDVSNVTNMQNMFFLASSFNQSIGGWDLSGLESSATSIADMLYLCGMDTDHYDATLNGWAAQSANFPADLVLGAEGLSYSCTGKEGRDVLINSLNWTITGDALDGVCAPALNGDISAPRTATALLLYPNPANDVLQMELNGERLDRVEIRDRLGRLLWSQSIRDDRTRLQLNLNNGSFPTGMYIVSVFSEDGLLVTKQLSVIK